MSESGRDRDAERLSDGDPHLQLRGGLDRLGTATSTLADHLERMQALLRATAELVEPTNRALTTAATPSTAGRSGTSAHRDGVDGDGRSSTDDVPGVLSLAEVARRTGRHPDLLRRWSETGRIPAIRVGRAWAIPEARLASIDWPATRRGRSRELSLDPSTDD